MGTQIFVPAGADKNGGRLPVLVYDCNSKQYFSLGEDSKENKTQSHVRGALPPPYSRKEGKNK